MIDPAPTAEKDAGVSDYMRGYMQGVADAGARVIACAAAELGPDHPLVDRMVERLGSVVIPPGRGEPQ